MDKEEKEEKRKEAMKKFRQVVADVKGCEVEELAFDSEVKLYELGKEMEEEKFKPKRSDRKIKRIYDQKYREGMD